MHVELENYSLQNSLALGENGLDHSIESLFYLRSILIVEMVLWELRTRILEKGGTKMAAKLNN